MQYQYGKLVKCVMEPTWEEETQQTKHHMNEGVRTNMDRRNINNEEWLD
jgi:hypothetical protein